MQLLYDLGLEAESNFASLEGPFVSISKKSITLITIPWPPLPGNVPNYSWSLPPQCLFTPLPLRLTDLPTSITAWAARTKLIWTAPSTHDMTSQTVTDYLIGPHDMATISLSPDPYGHAFEETLALRKWDLDKHPTGGLRFITKNRRLILASMDASTPGARVDKWRSRIQGAWLQSINSNAVSTLDDVLREFGRLSETRAGTYTLTFAHPELSPDISQHGLPIISSVDYFSQFTHDQLNNRLNLIKRGPTLRRLRKYDIVESGDVSQYTTRVMRLTRGRLLKQDDWLDWQQSEYLQLNQYADQHCFGKPTMVDQDDAVFYLVWTYNIKALDGRKKAWCACNGSSPSGSVKVLDKVYANCIDQTSSCLFYAVSAAENLLIFGSDICNAFAEAPPPKQGFFIRPDRAFHEWW